MTKHQIHIYNSLRKLRIPPHVRGYEFLKSAMSYIHSNPNSIYSVTKDLYPGVAAIHNTTASKVERGIRFAIKSIKADDAEVYSVLGRTGHMTNSQFIATLNESIWVEMALEKERFKGPEHYREFHESRDELLEEPRKF